VDSLAPARLVDRVPEVDARRMAASLVPPRQFVHAGLDNYRPDPDYPSQQGAVDAVRAFTADWTSPPGGLFRRGPKPPERPGLYLDGGFGVGKTHLLAALWQQAPGRKYFGTFIEYTALVGALGYAAAVRLLTGSSLLAIDEFELDDPGDTMMMTRMLGELVASGTRIAATSNTPPNALGEGRFAASDFLREIQSLSSNFQTVRIDGLDYRRRDTTGSAVTVEPTEYERVVTALAGRGETVTSDGFQDLIAHLATVHPSRYIKIIDGVDVIGLRDVEVLHDQMAALRLVAFIDRVYDAEIPIVQSGVPLSDVFDDEMLGGGYRKKYLRSTSRMIALTAGELPPHDD